MATIIAMKVGRDQKLGLECRRIGVPHSKLVGYTSEQATSCLSRAFDLLGLGQDALRKIPCNSEFQMDPDALNTAIDKDLANGLTSFVIIGTAGSVNVGAIDDLPSLADIAAKRNLWLHVDGAFGATAILSDTVKSRLDGLQQADSLAFDFHKWLHVNYDAGCVLIRSGESHFQSFSGKAEYLHTTEHGLAAGSPWPVDFGP